MTDRIVGVESILAGDAHFVRLTVESGDVGIGQSACWGYPAAVDAVVQSFSEYLIAKDPSRIEDHWQHLYRMAPFRGSILMAAISAVDIALWDLKGKKLQVPVWELLGGRCRDRIRLHLLLEGKDDDALLDETMWARDEGFTAVKFDPLPVGYQDLSLPSLANAVERRVGAIRDVAGDDVDLIIEFHRALTPLQAETIVPPIARFRPLFIEDPIQIDSIEAQARLARRFSMPIGLGERFHSIWEFEELLQRGGIAYLRPDVGLAGGISHCKKIAAIAEAHHVAIVTHNFLGPVITAASCHLDLAIPNFVVQEYRLLDEQLASRGYSSPFHRKGGYLELSDCVGLGVDIPEQPEALNLIGRRITSIPQRADGSVAFSV